ncbi:hypothetical protein [Pyrobaculum aerophilum]|uniref:Uncharacterized protein n=2 Tax=Pyrobaculum aerophilum TaxID=13773 RepID=Q8ZTS9_PYRAE|nr:MULTISPECIES: hypothetical protein [Pyrobaculum]AAL64680.1 hypothetical protein PAE3112 [Pyrobaculum aerophilum str. IM2]MCX8136536.1 hypothetical protein [Pyrobaculum aerophilum]RFA93331.1 hypothetical protein CGL51_13035 [Pyrobaculum aerophilum]RFA95777.1 hypothetical protein CGL52_12340 [Pyrobaculum aerophilum]HII46199.1 hypothetical protein [Pyrobaculum aerophilum]
MIVKLIYIRDVAIIKLGLDPCADVFTFKISGREIVICGKTLILSDSLEKFKKGLLILGTTPYFVECENGECIAARAQI